jgi:hypothetical protein
MSILAKIRDRWAPLLLVAGAGVAASVFVPHVPRERTVALRLEDAASVTGVDLAWAPVGTGDRDAVQGGTWRFQAGHAPKEIATPVRLPDGRYQLEVTVERGAEHEEIRRAITLGDADRITVPLR